MANVSSNGIRGCAAEISNVISVTSSLSKKVQEACNDISSANEILQSYDNAIVKGSHGFIKKYSKVNDQNGWIDKEYVNRWKITGLDTSGNVNALNEMANEVSNIVSNVKSEVASIEEIATAIDSYINSINTQLSEVGPALLTSDMLSAAYLAIAKDGVAKANLATSGEDINNRNFINYSDIKDNGLANTKLSFVLQDDGSYRVYSNGKETEPEFYTTGLAAAFYQKTLKREYNNNTSLLDELSDSNTTTTKNKITIKTDSITEDGKTIPAGTYLRNKDGKYQKESTTVIENFWGEHLDGKPNGTNVTKDQFTAGELSNLKQNTNVSSGVPVSQKIDNNGVITLNSGEKIYSGEVILTEDNTSYLVQDEGTGKWLQYDSAGNRITNSFSPFMDHNGEISLDLNSNNINIK